jgi:hypothetical protein
MMIHNPVSTVQTKPAKTGFHIIPAAACLTFLTAGSVSLYGDCDTICLITVIAFFCMIFLTAAVVVAKRTGA